MDEIKAVTGKGATWCGVLETETRPAAPGVAVRTVRGRHTALFGRATGGDWAGRRSRRPASEAK